MSEQNNGLWLSSHKVLQVGVKKNLFLGSEREPLMMIGLLLFTALYANFSVLTIIFVILFWFIALTTFRQMAKANPNMTKIYIRYIFYKKFYPARASVFCNYSRRYNRKQ